MPDSSLGQQYATPPVGDVAAADANAADDLFEWAARRPDHTSFARKADGLWGPVTAKQFADRVLAVSAGLVAAGVRPGDRVGLIGETSYEWAVCDFAVWAAGAITVPVYPTSSTAQTEWILNDSSVAAALVQDDRLRSVVLDVRPACAGRVWVMANGGLDVLAALGEADPKREAASGRRPVPADSPATIVYTSGTTGRPKGCVLTHRNLKAEVGSVLAAEGIAERVLTEDARLLLFLPLAHIFARVVLLAAVRAGARVAFTHDLSHLTRDLAEVRPDVIVVVPRVLEKLYNTAARKAIAAGHPRLFDAAADTAVAYSHALAEDGPGWRLRARRRVFDRPVYAKLRAALGGRVRYAASGGAPLDARVGHFMLGAGINVLEGWGMTETSAAVTLNLPARQRIGTVGRPLPGDAVRIEDGEILVKGPGVFSGYWNDEHATREAFDRQGWLRTGDLGELRDGYLTVVGRKKDLIVTSVGKNVAPAPLEDRLTAHWLIDRCVVVGDGRPYIGALVILDPESFAEWKRHEHRPARATVADLRDDPALRGVVQAAIDTVNADVSQAEAIRRFRIVPTRFTVGEQLTPTQKTRRLYVLGQLADEVDALYCGASAKV
jgi:long-chain acyl-CoA synthetase